MKKQAYILCSLVLGLWSCDLAVFCPENSRVDLQKTTLSAAFDPQSRVSLGTDLGCSWQAGDRIAVFDGTDIREFTLLSFDGPTATFEGEADGNSSRLYAACPYAGASASNDGSWTLELPSVQQLSPGDSVCAAALMAVAATSGPRQLSFRPVTSLVRITLSRDDIASVTLRGNGGEPLAGLVLADASSGAITSFPDPLSAVMLTHASGVFPCGTYYIPVSPGVFPSGLSLDLTTVSGAWASISISHYVFLERASCLDLGDVTTGVVWNSELNLDCGDTEDSDDNVARTTFDRRVRVVYSASGASVTGAGPSISATIRGNHVTLTNNGKETVIYDLSGQADDGSFKLYGTKKQAILLNGINLTNPSGAAVNNQCKKRTFVVVQGVNSLTDGPFYTMPPEGEDEKAVFFSEGQMVFSGHGLLSVRALGKAGISSDDYLRFMSSPTVRVRSSAGHGMRGKQYVLISAGTLDVAVSADMKKGIVSDSLVCVTGGKTVVDITGGAAYDPEDGDYSGSAGIKADRCFVMDGGEVSITNSGTGGKGIRVGSNTDLSPLTESRISGGTLSVHTTGDAHTKGDVSSKAVMVGWALRDTRYTYSDSSGDLLVCGGDVSIVSDMDEALEVKGALHITDGTLYCMSPVEDAINTGGTLTVSGGRVFASGARADGMDSNGDLIIEGGWVFSVGAMAPEHSLDANYEAGRQLILRGGTIVTVGAYHPGAIFSQLCAYTYFLVPEQWYALSQSGKPTVAFRFPRSSAQNLTVCMESTGIGLHYSVQVSGGESCFEDRVRWDPSVSGGKPLQMTDGFTVF